MKLRAEQQPQHHHNVYVVLLAPRRWPCARDATSSMGWQVSFFLGSQQLLRQPARFSARYTDFQRGAPKAWLPQVHVSEIHQVYTHFPQIG